MFNARNVTISLWYFCLYDSVSLYFQISKYRALSLHPSTSLWSASFENVGVKQNLFRTISYVCSDWNGKWFHSGTFLIDSLTTSEERSLVIPVVSWFYGLMLFLVWVIKYNFLCLGDITCLCYIVQACWRPYAWWRHQMEIFSALLALCAGNSPVTGEIPSQRPVTHIFALFFDLRLNKRLCIQSRGWWFETPSSSLWRNCNEIEDNAQNMAFD